jgi:hypothetical protein
LIRGVLISKRGQKAVVLTTDGAFQDVRLKRSARVVVGQTVLDYHIQAGIPFMRKVTLSLSAALILLFSSFGSIGPGGLRHAVAAYVSFDVNPSIEAAIDRRMHVVTVKALNKDAENILKECRNFRGMSLNAFMYYISNRLARHGYLTDKNEVVVSTAVTGEVPHSEKKAFLTALNRKIEKIANDRSFKRSAEAVKVIHTTLHRRNQAAKFGLTAGKYVLYLKKSKEQRGLTIDQAKAMSVKELRNEIPRETVKKKPSVHTESRFKALSIREQSLKTPKAVQKGKSSVIMNLGRQRWRHPRRQPNHVVNMKEKEEKLFLTKKREKSFKPSENGIRIKPSAHGHHTDNRRLRTERWPFHHRPVSVDRHGPLPKRHHHVHTHEHR